MDHERPIEIWLSPYGGFPNSRLPVLYYPKALRSLKGDPDAVEELFYSHGWRGAWINGVYPFDHFHSTTHEVLAVIAGEARLRLGGPAGKSFLCETGDVLVLPAGVAHAYIHGTRDFRVLGAYPEGRSWDLRLGDPGELPVVLAHLGEVPIPKSDPLYGPSGPLVEIWTSIARENQS
ncbi:cupin domain-containing protein [Candidatus Methylacidithermus pantelleriae]|uniref:Cupin_2 domain-containing protein n=1 Tax=Candidatus Methylacidithermus pantelleriae TaxID=2744239 RepID=A0A8J2FW85_9BACT|nr:cupin domain-containing protein [Candidatus Methylacidithermus pantelleriae]CAF0697844.1 Cupin_2 domain-containing protein [Candidatus Methylacidithermus pantelleriae]